MLYKPEKLALLPAALLKPNLKLLAEGTGLNTQTIRDWLRGDSVHPATDFVISAYLKGLNNV